MRLNVITVHLQFENKINSPALPFGNKPCFCHHSAQQWAFLSLFRPVFAPFRRIPISWWLSEHTLLDICELIRKLKKKCYWVIDILRISHKQTFLKCLVRFPFRKDRWPYFTFASLETTWSHLWSFLSRKKELHCLTSYQLFFTFSEYKVTSKLLKDCNAQPRLRSRIRAVYFCSVLLSVFLPVLLNTHRLTEVIKLNSEHCLSYNRKQNVPEKVSKELRDKLNKSVKHQKSSF